MPTAREWKEARIEVGHRRMQLRHAGVDQHARIGMVDDVHVDRHPLALDEPWTIATTVAELDRWVTDYNTNRPHQALEMATPADKMPEVEIGWVLTAEDPWSST